jgi:hypothetical protein
MRSTAGSNTNMLALVGANARERLRGLLDLATLTLVGSEYHRSRSRLSIRSQEQTTRYARVVVPCSSATIAPRHRQVCRGFVFKSVQIMWEIDTRIAISRAIALNEVFSTQSQRNYAVRCSCMSEHGPRCLTRWSSAALIL